MNSSTAIAHPNIALIKYWGNRDNSLRLPANGSISMNLEELFTRTKVTWEKEWQTSHADRQTLTINGITVTRVGLQRMVDHGGVLELMPS